MFALINTRWFYADQDYILAIHPVRMKPILYLRHGKNDKDRVDRILKACKMMRISEVIEDEGEKYILLKEAKVDGKKE